MWIENIYSPGDCDSFKNLLELGIDYDEMQSTEELYKTIFYNISDIESRKDHIMKIVQRLINEYSCLEKLVYIAAEQFFKDSE